MKTKVKLSKKEAKFILETLTWDGKKEKKAVKKIKSKIEKGLKKKKKNTETEEVIMEESGSLVEKCIDTEVKSEESSDSE